MAYPLKATSPSHTTYTTQPLTFQAVPDGCGVSGKKREVKERHVRGIGQRERKREKEDPPLHNQMGFYIPFSPTHYSRTDRISFYSLYQIDKSYQTHQYHMNNVKKLLHYSNRVKKAVSSNRSIFQLPELPYEYDDLEPHIDEKTMKTHHTKHHQGYVDGLNEAIKKLHLARESDNYDEIRHWERELSFNGSGHINHTIFWRSMTPGGVDQPEGLKRELKKNFGSIEKFESHFKKAASSVEGSGWGMLRWEPVSEKLFVTTTQNHQNNTMTGSFPVLLVDVWEHAYYLSYLNDRSSYLDEWWKVVDWQRVHKRIRVLKNKKIPSL